MKSTTESLARSITRKSSKLTYWVARLLVDKDLVNDFFRAYAYFRWADDIIDAPITKEDDTTRRACLLFVEQQKELINRFYRGERPENLTPEECILADLISNDQGENSGLQSFIRNMFAVIEFDAHRRGRLISQDELTWYSEALSKSVTNGLQYFIGNDHSYPDNDYRFLAAKAAHIAHLLRDVYQDNDDGFINIPREFLEEHEISPQDVHSLPFRNWVRERVDLARRYFCEGKLYLESLEVLRCKIAGYWYCARFEGVLDDLDGNGYTLRTEYGSWYKFRMSASIVRLCLSVTIKHLTQMIFRDTKRVETKITSQKCDEEQEQNIQSLRI